MEVEEFLPGLRSPDTADPVDEQVTAGLLALAHTLGLTGTAEGVETATRAERLRALGRDAGQGWHLGRPEPPQRLAPLLTDRPTSATPAVPEPE